LSADLSLFLRSLERPLQDSIRDLRRGYQSVCECLGQTMAESDIRAAEVANCRRQLAESRRSLSEAERQLAERVRTDGELSQRCAGLKKQLDSKQIELAQAVEKLLRAEAEEAQCKQRLDMQSEQNQQLREQITRMESEAELSRGELARLRGQFTPLAESAVETAELRVQLAAEQAELVRLRETAAVRGDSLLSEQLAAERTQRSELESELDVLRHRSAELSETLAEQKRLWAVERDQWNEELRQLRRALERQADLLAQRGAQTADDQPGAARPAATREADAVVGALREQFEMLQRNKVRQLAKTAS